MGLASTRQTLTIAITDLDDRPIPVNDLLDSNEDDVLVISSEEVLRNDIDPDLLTNEDEELTVIIMPESFTTSLGATVSFDESDGRITYNPLTSQTLQELAPGESLEDRFTYAVTDERKNPLPTAEVILTIHGRNDAPAPVDDELNVSPDATTLLRPLSNDTTSMGPSMMRRSLSPSSLWKDRFRSNPTAPCCTRRASTSRERIPSATRSVTISGSKASRRRSRSRRPARPAPMMTKVERLSTDLSTSMCCPMTRRMPVRSILPP